MPTASAAVVGLTRSLAREAAPYGVTVNCIRPGLAEAGLGPDLRRDVTAAAVAATPLSRVATAAEVGAAAVYLASAQAGFTTGALLDINGGIHMGSGGWG